MTKRNQYGEIPLHRFARKGNLVKLQQCLLTLGIEINCQDNNGWTPLHEAVAGNKLEVVRILLNYSPRNHTLHQYFPLVSPSKTAVKKVDRVDLLLCDKENGQNPVHEAVINDSLEIVRLFLDTVSQNKSGFPNLSQLMKAKTKDGNTLLSLAKTSEMKNLIKSFTDPCSGKNNVENFPPSGPLLVTNLPRFEVFLSLSITKYIATNYLGHVYGAYKHIKLDQVISASKEGKYILPNDEQEQFCGRQDLGVGLVSNQFDRKARFDLYRPEITKGRDLKDFEQLLYYEKKFLKMEEKHPIVRMLHLLKI